MQIVSGNERSIAPKQLWEIKPSMIEGQEVYICLLYTSASGVTDSHGVTGGVYKTRERIHRDILIRDY